MESGDRDDRSEGAQHWKRESGIKDDETTATTTSLADSCRSSNMIGIRRSGKSRSADQQNCATDTPAKCPQTLQKVSDKFQSDSGFLVMVSQRRLFKNSMAFFDAF